MKPRIIVICLDENMDVNKEFQENIIDESIGMETEYSHFLGIEKCGEIEDPKPGDVVILYGSKNTHKDKVGEVKKKYYTNKQSIDGVTIISFVVNQEKKTVDCSSDKAKMGTWEHSSYTGYKYNNEQEGGAIKNQIEEPVKNAKKFVSKNHKKSSEVDNKTNEGLAHKLIGSAAGVVLLGEALGTGALALDLGHAKDVAKPLTDWATQNTLASTIVISASVLLAVAGLVYSINHKKGPSSGL